MRHDLRRGVCVDDQVRSFFGRGAADRYTYRYSAPPTSSSFICSILPSCSRLPSIVSRLASVVQVRMPVGVLLERDAPLLEAVFWLPLLKGGCQLEFCWQRGEHPLLEQFVSTSLCAWYKPPCMASHHPNGIRCVDSDTNCFQCFVHCVAESW